MKNLGKLPKLESNRVESDYILMEICVGVITIAFVIFIIALIVSMSNLSGNALKECLGNGYTVEYCKSSL